MPLFSRYRFVTIVTALSLLPFAANAEPLTVKEQIVIDYRPVIARLESGDTATARSRLAGTISTLSVDEGSVVRRGDIIARVVDTTLTPKIAALTDRIAGLRTQLDQLVSDLARAEDLYQRGIFPKTRLDETRTAVDIARSTLAGAQSERAALIARRNEGAVISPADATVTAVHVVQGSVVSPGEIIAELATLDGVVRLSLPERHAGQLSEGETLNLRLPSRNGSVHQATIVKIYPELRNGAVIADAVVDHELSALVGERVDVLAPVGERRALLIPADYIDTRYGVDFIRIHVGEYVIDAPVALASTTPDANGQVESLAGLKPGDRIEKP